MNQPLLIVGGDGLIGRALREHCLRGGQPTIATLLTEAAVPGKSFYFDLTRDPWPTLPPCGAAVICAAITSQDQCRRDPTGTRDLNVVRTLRLIRLLTEAGTFVVFISSNLVFDGTRPARLAEDAFSPQTEYGRQKAEVERALADFQDRTAVVRLTKVFHPRARLLEDWLAKLALGVTIDAYADYVCSPIELSRVVEAIARVAAEQRAGIWQFSGPEDISYFEIACSLARADGRDLSLIRSAPVPPGTLEHIALHTTLDASRARDELNLAFPPPQDVIESIQRIRRAG